MWSTQHQFKGRASRQTGGHASRQTIADRQVDASRQTIADRQVDMLADRQVDMLADIQTAHEVVICYLDMDLSTMLPAVVVNADIT